MRLLGTVVLLGLVSSFVNASMLTEREKLSDFEQLVSMIRSNYGPLKYKAETQGISLDLLESQYRAIITATKSNKEFYHKLVQFAAAFKDSHFSVSIPTDYYAHLGFTTDLVEGKVVIDTVTRTILPKSVFPYDRGDQLVSLDGKKMSEVLDTIQAYLGAGFQQSSRRRAAMAVAIRSGARLPVPTGPVSIEFRTLAQSDKTTVVGINWIEVGEPFDDSYVPTRQVQVRANKKTPETFNLSVKEFDDELLPYKIEESYRCSGTTRIRIPDGATILSEKPIVIYYHPTPKGNIGYIRLPHYKTGATQVESILYAIERAMLSLKANTVGLVIDQDHNCGGVIFQVDETASFFLDKPINRLKFQLRASKAEILKHAGSALEPILKASWLKGDFLTPPMPLMSDPIVPITAGLNYDKPIVMLIDEMAGSGGDAFPALLQGNGRAKLIGTRTMGAGGSVEQYSMSLSFSAMNLRMTRSLFYRPDGIAVENNGVIPDYPYTITMEDFLNGYQKYQSFYLEKLAMLLP